MKFPKVLIFYLLFIPIWLLSKHLRLDDPIIFQRFGADRTGKIIIFGKLLVMDADGSHLR
ncbi:MAG: hypothetical protein CMI18_13640 [Opitutaceae bacterium]|nr:hypothetical protein [Opitutaceae bacterium]